MLDNPWTILATADPADGTIDTTWFRDVSAGACGVTSLSARTRAGGKDAEDVCMLTFKASSWAFLGPLFCSYYNTLIPRLGVRYLSLCLLLAICSFFITDVCQASQPLVRTCMMTPAQKFRNIAAQLTRFRLRGVWEQVQSIETIFRGAPISRSDAVRVKRSGSGVPVSL